TSHVDPFHGIDTGSDQFRNARFVKSELSGGPGRRFVFPDENASVSLGTWLLAKDDPPVLKLVAQSHGIRAEHHVFQDFVQWPFENALQGDIRRNQMTRG